VTKLFEKAYWTHEHESEANCDTYNFPTFWNQVSLPDVTPRQGRKRPITTISTKTLENFQPLSTVHEQLTPGAASVPNSETLQTLHPRDVSASEGSTQDFLFLGAVSVPKGGTHGVQSTETVSVSNENTGAVLGPEGEPHDMQQTEAVSAVVGSVQDALHSGDVSVPEGVSPAQPMAATLAPKILQISKAHSQYITYHGSSDFRAFKQWKGINGHIYITKEQTGPVTTYHMGYHTMTQRLWNLFPHFFSIY
jgi:hypothetical protein